MASSLDEKGRKMSKSLGNPSAAGGDRRIRRRHPAALGDVFRHTEDLRIGKEILKQQAELYRRIRNTLRWLLGNLAGFERERDGPRELPELERWVLHRLAELDARIAGAAEITTGPA